MPLECAMRPGRMLRRILGAVLLRAVVAVALLQPAPNTGNALQKVGKGKYAHWPIATHTTASHKITVALAVDATPARIKLKFVDTLADTGAQGEKALREERDHARGRQIRSQRIANGRFTPKVGFILLENREGSCHLFGMQINEAYRGQGLAKVLVAIWVALCLAAGVSMRSGQIDKPILAHVLHSLGFSAQGGAMVEVSDATRLRDCTFARGTPRRKTGWAADGSEQGAGGEQTGRGDREQARREEERARALGRRLVRVGAPYVPPSDPQVMIVRIARRMH